MKLAQAVYEIEIGMNYEDIDTDNMRSVKVLAIHAVDAIKKVSLERGEYITEVKLISRVDP